MPLAMFTEYICESSPNLPMDVQHEQSIYSSIIVTTLTIKQGGITCGAIDEPRKSSKAIDECVIINFRDKNVIIARFCDKNVVIARFCDKNGVLSYSILSIAILIDR